VVLWLIGPIRQIAVELEISQNASHKALGIVPLCTN
jgi:hypothetical protein